MCMVASYLYNNYVKMEKESKPGILIKNVTEILVRDGCDWDYNGSRR